MPCDSRGVLKLTLPGHYGILSFADLRNADRSEVDPTGSLWYKKERLRGKHRPVLKPTLPGHYGIATFGEMQAAGLF